MRKKRFRFFKFSKNARYTMYSNSIENPAGCKGYAENSNEGRGMAVRKVKKSCAGYRGVLLSLFLFFVFFVNSAQAASLPDVLGELGETGGPDRWVADPPRATALETASENLGLWQNRVYRRAAPIASVEVSLMEGEGFGTLYIPDGAASDGALFPASSGYETLKIDGKYAILESSELTGLSLSVALGRNRTLLAESAGLSAEELRGFTERLVRALPAEE
jgi:hypothetical protein